MLVCSSAVSLHYEIRPVNQGSDDTPCVVGGILGDIEGEPGLTRLAGNINLAAMRVDNAF